MPTLIEKGKIEIPKGTSATEKNRINLMVAKDYVLERIGKRVGPDRYTMSSFIKSWPDKIILLTAGTGSGKSVTLPPEIYIKFRDQLGRNIAVTQPRVVSAVRTVTEDIIKHYPLTIGKDVGYQTRALAKKPTKGLIYMTIGVLLQQLRIMESVDFMKKYSFIIIDEAHERSLANDITMYFLKSLLQEFYNDPMCPIVIFVSATMETDRFSKYFSTSKSKPEIINVLGKTYAIDENFLIEPAGNYIWKIIDIIKDVHENEDDFGTGVQDILVFVSGNAQIKKLTEELEKINLDLDHKLYPIGFTGTVYKEGSQGLRDMEAPLETLKILNVTPKRKVIISTPAAETSITIESLKYVIDSGFRNAVEFDPAGYTTFVVKPVSKDMAKQRRGRVGRVAPGQWYPIFTEEAFNLFQEAKFPDIIITDITTSILSLIVKDGILDMNKLDLMDKPPGDSLHYALEKLYTLGAITSKDIMPTEIGIIMNRFRNIRLENIKMILSGYHYGANVLDLITIAVMSENTALLGRKYQPRVVFENENRQIFLLSDTFIDLIFLFDEFRSIVALKNMNKISEWCINNDVSYNEMLTVIDNRDSLIEDMIGVVGFDPLYNGLSIDPSKYSLLNLSATMDIFIDEVIKIKNCIMEGYRMNLAILDDSCDIPYYKTMNGLRVEKPATLREQPRFFIYCDLLLRDNRGEFQRGVAGPYSVMDNFVPIDPTLL